MTLNGGVVVWHNTMQGCSFYSTMGTKYWLLVTLMFTLNGETVVWHNTIQGCIIDSTTETEYVATYEAAKEVVQLKKFLTNLEVVPNMSMPITLLL